MSVRPLGAFSAPRGVAVVGASCDPSKVGGSVLANLRTAGFEGRVVPVNARAETVQGLPATPSLLAVDGPVDHGAGAPRRSRRAAVDREALAETIARLPCLAVEVPELAEIELNPLIASVEARWR